MKTTGLICVLLVLGFLMAGCAYNVTSGLPGVFKTEYLNDKTSTRPVDLQSGAKCPGTQPLHVESKESRAEAYTVYSMAGTSYTIIPSEYVVLVAQYMEDELRESNIQVDATAGKKIEVVMEEVHADGAWSFGCDVKLKIAIPEISYTQVYSGHEGGAIIMNAIAYATHLAIVQFLEDPVVRKYIQCLD